MPVTQIMLAVLGGGALVELIRSLFGRRKMVVDVAQVIAQAAATTVGAQDDVIERLQQQAQALVLQVDNLRHENGELRSSVDTLHTENAVLRLEVAELKTLVLRLEAAIGRQ